MFIVLGVSHDGQKLCMLSQDNEDLCITFCTALRFGDDAKYMDYNVYKIKENVDLTDMFSDGNSIKIF